MKTHGWVAMALVAILLAVSVPASADFHPDCSPPAAAYANTELVAQYDDYGNAQLLYEGLVYCPDSPVDIHDVRIAPAGSDEELAHTDNEGCQSALDSPCTAEDVVDDPGEGFYDVNMTFSTGNFTEKPRLQRFYWPGAGQPVPVCAHVGFFPVKAGDCPGGPLG